MPRFRCCFDVDVTLLAHLVFPHVEDDDIGAVPSGEVAGDGHGFWLWVDPSTARTIRSNIDASFVPPGKPGIQPGHLEGRETLFERSVRAHCPGVALTRAVGELSHP